MARNGSSPPRPRHLLCPEGANLCCLFQTYLILEGSSSRSLYSELIFQRLHVLRAVVEFIFAQMWALAPPSGPSQHLQTRTILNLWTQVGKFVSISACRPPIHEFRSTRDGIEPNTFLRDPGAKSFPGSMAFRHAQRQVHVQGGTQDICDFCLNSEWRPSCQILTGRAVCCAQLCEYHAMCL